MALPKLLDELVAKRIVEAVRAGASRTAAAEAARVGRSTLFEWLRRGAAGDAPYAAFLTRVREAEGALELELVKVIIGHGATSWQSCAWMLERKFGRRWALRRPEPIAPAPPMSEDEAERVIAEAVSVQAETERRRAEPADKP